MKKEYDNYLCRTYPKIFKDRRADVTKSCFAFGFEIGDGWFNIINGLALIIQGHIDSVTRERWRIRKNKRKYAAMSDEDKVTFAYMADAVAPERVQQVVVSQVKEKFGALRFYYYGGDDAVHNYVSMAEAMSYVTCEECGAPGKVNRDGWISVRCVEHGGKDFFGANPETFNKV